MATERMREAETVALKDGSIVTLRPIRPDDAQRLQAFHARLSPETVYLRWLSAHPVLTEAEATDLKAGKFYVAALSRVSPRLSARADLNF